MIEFGTRTLPTSCSSAANSASRRSRADEPEPVDDAQGQLDHVAAVHARVLVVGLDHVAEQEGGAAVGVAQLELVVDPHAALAREDREQADQRQREQHAVRRRLGRERDGEPDRREARRRSRRPRPSRAGGCLGGTPSVIHWRAAVTAKSSANCAAQRRQVERPLAERGRSTRPRARARARARSRTRRSAGAARGARGAACRAGTRASSRAGRPPPRPAAPGRSAAGTASARGSARVGTAVPLPISNSSRNAAAYAPMSTSAAATPGARSDGR